MLQIDPTILVALISLLGTFVVAAMNQGKYTKADAIKLEQRLSMLEGSADKVDLLYDTLVKKGLQLLLSPHTPALDLLMKQAMNGLDDLSVEDTQKLVDGLEAEYISNDNADSGKRLVATLVEAAIKKVKGLNAVA